MWLGRPGDEVTDGGSANQSVILQGCVSLASRCLSVVASFNPTS